MAKKVSKPVDCRRCAHGYNFEHGLGYRCVKSETRFPWECVASEPCAQFQAKPAPGVDCRECIYLRDAQSDGTGLCAKDGKQIISVEPGPCEKYEPAPASPPASADREGPDLLEAAKAIRQYVHGNYTWDSTYARARDAFASAISAEEARRARPAAEDPRDATIRDLRALVGRYATALVEIAREDHDFDRIEAIARAVLAGDSGVLDPRCALLQKCATALLALDGCVLWSDEQDWHLHGRLRTSAALAACRDTLASLRSAGVEPAPAQEGKATT